MSDAVAAAPLPEVRGGHPKGLYVLFATEMWERFSYYGMRALLVLYLLHQLGWQPVDSSATFKWYTSMAFFTPLLGGRLIVNKHSLRGSIVIGGVLIAIGHFLMGFPSVPLLFTALGLLVVGTGFFKPNISTLVGRMYTEHDPRRNSAFTIFYVGINTGAALAPLVCGTLRQHFGFHYGFAAAGVGMVIGLITFLLGQKRVNADVEAAGNTMGIVKTRAWKDAAPDAREPDESRPGHHGFAGVLTRVTPPLMIGAGIVVILANAIALARGRTSVLDVVMPIMVALIGIAMGFVLRSIKGAARDKSTVIFVLFTFTVLFWMAFEQAGNALNIWADMHTDLHIGSYEYPAEYWQFVNSILIVTLGPLFSVLWIALARRGIEPSTPAKMLAALVFMAFSFGAMVTGAQAENRGVTRVALAELPKDANVERFDAGRLRYDAASHELEVHGVLAPFAVTKALEAVAAPEYRDALTRVPTGDVG